MTISRGSSFTQCDDLRDGRSPNLAKEIDAERRRIAVGLHDDVGQTLAAANLRVHELRLGSTDARQTTTADEIEALIRHAIDAIRALTFELRTPALPSEGFTPIIEELAARFTREHGIPCLVDSDIRSGDLAAPVADMLYHVAVELLRNVAAHACAAQARISVSMADGIACLRVSDDGDGFDVDAPRTGVGLLIAEERTHECGGSLMVGSGSSGTTVSVLLPSLTGEGAS